MVTKGLGTLHWPVCNSEAGCPNKHHWSWPSLPGVEMHHVHLERPTVSLASLYEHSEITVLERRSATVIFTIAVRYSLAEITMPRWQQYSALHGYDFLWVRSRNKNVTGEVTAAWDRVFVAQQLFSKGYREVMHVDGDTAVLAWETPVTEYIRSSAGPFANASSDSFLYVSQDRARFGAYQPSKKDFNHGISLHSGGQVSGPNNFAVWIMRRSVAALTALEQLVTMSTRQDWRFQRFPAEQGVINAWLGQNCSCKVDSANASRMLCPPWGRMFLAPTRPCTYAQASYGTFQRFLGRGDEPIHTKKPRQEWATALKATLKRYRDAGVFVLHTPSMGEHRDFLFMTFRMVQELFPIELPPDASRRSRTSYVWLHRRKARK